MNVTTLSSPPSPLFTAAIELLKGPSDPIALRLALRDRYPRYSLKEIDQAIRETAVVFHAEAVS